MKTRSTIRAQKQRLTKGQQEVLDVFTTYGVALPDHALVPLAQHALRSKQSSSGIRSRRHELCNKGLLVRDGETTTGSGRKAVVYKVR